MAYTAHIISSQGLFKVWLSQALAKSAATAMPQYWRKVRRTCQGVNV